jgi:RNA polymerase sigma-70 factor (ECF subfamily)
VDLNSEDIRALKGWLEKELSRLGPLPVSVDDLVGEVLLRLLAADAAQPIHSPFAYARTILRNLVRDEIRHLERAERALETLGCALESSPRNAAEQDFLEDGELVNYLLENTPLSSTQEQVIRMIYFQGMTMAEVARELSKNPGTIQRHHDRAIQKLAVRASALRIHA